MVPRAGLDDVTSLLTLPGSRTPDRPVPQTSRCMDYRIPTRQRNIGELQIYFNCALQADGV